MKKTLIALAALASMAGVAHAQSSVTLYGVADAWFGQIKTENQVGLTTTDLKQTVVNGSGLSSSRWGFRGSEDLGGGLKAVFTLESGFDISTGQYANTGGQGGPLFGRQAFVGLSGGFGTVSLGRQYTAYDTLRGATNMIYDSNTFATTSAVWGNGVADYQNRASNTVAYTSPSFGGVSGAVVIGLGEDKANASAAVVGPPAVAAQPATDASSNASLHIKYANGPLLVGYAYQREKQEGNKIYFVATPVTGAAATPVAFTDSRKYNLLGASYDFGVAKLVGQYNTAKRTGVKDKEFQVGVSVPFGAAAIAAGYSRSKSEGVGANNTGKGVSLLGTYSLSKRTTVYAGGLGTEIETANGANSLKTTAIAAGVRHTF